MTIVDALLAISRADLDAGRLAAEAAASANPDSLLAPALVDFLGQARETGVYTEPSAFEQFIDNGDNPNLYACTIDRLAQIHRRATPDSVLDIGCGDGRVTAAVVQPGTRYIDLLDPSTELLDAAQRRVSTCAAITTVHATGIGELLARLDDQTSWDNNQ